MTKGFGTTTGNKKPGKHQTRQLAMTSFIAKHVLTNKAHRQVLTSVEKNHVPVMFYPSKEEKLRNGDIEMVHFPFGWNKDGKYPQNYLPIVTFSISEEEYMNGSGRTMTHWQVHLYDTDRNILTSPYWVGDDLHVGAMNLDEGIKAPVPDDFTQFNNEFMEAFLIWMADNRTMAA